MMRTDAKHKLAPLGKRVRIGAEYFSTAPICTNPEKETNRENWNAHTTPEGGLMTSQRKKQLCVDLKILSRTIKTYGGETYIFELHDAGIAGLDGLIERHGELITLFDASDRTAIALDFLRGSCVKRRRKTHKTESTNNTEYESWI